MYDQRRISLSKWTGFGLAVVVLSQGIARSKSFFEAPTAMTYVGALVALTLLLGLLFGLAVAVYAEEKAKGNLQHPMPFFDRWSDRFFLKP